MAAQPGKGAMMAPPTESRRRWTWLDTILIALVVIVIATIAWRAQTVLNYRWNWGPVWNFVIRWDPERQTYVANLILQGLATTVRVSVWSALVAAIIGLAMGLARVSKSLFLRLVSRTYVEMVRNIPPLVFLFVVFFFLSSQIVPALGIEPWVRTLSPDARWWIALLVGPPEFLPAVLSAVVCLGLFEGAYVTEIVRAGIQSVPRGQTEAGLAAGLTPNATLRHIVLPQALSNMTPPLAGQFISLVKDSSIVSLVSVQDLTFLGSEVAGTTSRVFETWIIVAVLYFCLCFSLSMLFRQLEARAKTGRQ